MNAPNTNIDSRGSDALIETVDASPASGHAAAGAAAELLSLAAAPIFALMALVTGILGGPAHMICSPAQGASPLSGMVLMYVLMSVLHSGPWLKLISSRRTGAPRL